jgi:hypothetical protein
MYGHLSDIAFVGEILTAIESHKYYSPLAPKSEEVDEIYNGFHHGSLSYCFTALLGSCLEGPEVCKALQTFYRFSIPENLSNGEKLTQYKKMHELFTRYWQTVRAKMLAYLHKMDNIEPSENDWLVNKMNEYKGGSAHTFEAEQNAIRSAIRKEGMLHRSCVSASQR